MIKILVATICLGYIQIGVIMRCVIKGLHYVAKVLLCYIDLCPYCFHIIKGADDAQADQRHCYSLTEKFITK